MVEKKRNMGQLMKHPLNADDVTKQLHAATQAPKAGKKTFHAYRCDTGCGHTTIIDKYYKNKRVYCGVCGTKSTMVYQGDCTVNPTNKPSPFNIKKG